MRTMLEVKAEPTVDKSEVDIFVQDEGSIVVLYPHTPNGEEWMEMHMPEEAPRWGQGYAIEARYVSDILVGLIEGGLSLCAGIPEYDRAVS